MDQPNHSSAEIPARPKQPDTGPSTWSPTLGRGLPGRTHRSHKRYSESPAPSNLAMDTNESISGARERRRRRRHTDQSFEVEDPDKDNHSEEPVNKKAKIDTPLERDIIKKEAMSSKADWDIIAIGTHIDEPRLPIIAEMTKSGTVHITAFRDRTMPLAILQQWDMFFSADGTTIPLDKIKLDPDHFKGYSGVEPLNTKEKYDLIKEFLHPTKRARNATKKPNDDDDDIPARATTTNPGVAKSAPEPSELQVGLSKMDNCTPVYAYLRQDNQLWFRVHDAESRASKVQFFSTIIRYDQVVFDKEYVNANERAARAYIRSALQKATKKVEETVSEDKIGHTNREEAWTDIQTRLKMVVNRAVKEQEASACELGTVLQEYGKHSAHQSKRIVEQEVTIDRQLQTIELLRSRLADCESEPSGKPGSINEQVHDGPPKSTASSSTIDLKRFYVIPNDWENAGMLLENPSRQVQYNGAYYNERSLLQELKTAVRGQKSAEEVEIDGMMSTCYVEDDGSKKFIERPQSIRSFVEAEGRYFVKWVKRDEITVEQYWGV